MSSADTNSEQQGEPAMRFPRLRIAAALVACLAALWWAGPYLPEETSVWEGWWTSDDDDLVI